LKCVRFLSFRKNFRTGNVIPARTDKDILLLLFMRLLPCALVLGAGTSVMGTSVMGTSVMGISVKGTSVMGTSVKGTSVMGTSVMGTFSVDVEHPGES